ncbi:hypothetical protein GOP47_0009700 [Adiantum capillus-veneris]|uniref:C3H1-type domain-containing protein n=1 Tax=Adiantum capillus-veneris TaxID=13818 RepID=A0A9D4ZHG4_ADICA|nr:hypothetical protein GOP47_0009700 [Adiantum capillus-veneris]
MATCRTRPCGGHTTHFLGNHLRLGLRWRGKAKQTWACATDGITLFRFVSALNLDWQRETARMCGGPDQAHISPHMGGMVPLKGSPAKNVQKDYEMKKLHESGSRLLELAANDELDSFRKFVEEGNGKVDDVGLWYVRSSGGRQMALEQRTPAMIASLYGSLHVLTYIMSQYAMQGGDVDQACGSDGTSALHCAAAGGSTPAVQAVKILLNSGADVNVRDVQGRRPADVIVVPHGCAEAKPMLDFFLGKEKPSASYAEHDSNMVDQLKKCFAPSALEDIGISTALDVLSVKSSFSSSGLSTTSGASTLSLSPSASSSPKSPIALSTKGYVDDAEKARECSVDQHLPDIKNTFYTSDEFRMYSFKIRPCSRAYSHDWTECPFAHPGENARRRDPRRYHYSCVPCPDFRKGACSQGDTCEYAHGVFECWLHPAQYRTRLCKDGAECNRKVCFFAHKAEELRPVYAATGSGLPSPILSAFPELSCMSPPLGPCSPSMMPQFSPLQPIQSALQGSMRTPPMSPSSSSLSNAAWPQPNIPTLHLPGTSLQASRLRAALHARDVSASNDFDEQLLSDFPSPSAHSLSMQARLNAAVAASGSLATSSRSGRYKSLGLSLAPANLEELFATETLTSPGINMHEAPVYAQLEAENHHSVVSNGSPQSRLLTQFQSSPTQSSREVSCNLESIAMRKMFVEGQGRRIEGQGMWKGSPSPTFVGAKGNKGSWDVGGAGGCAWSDWGSPTGKPEWGIQEEDLSKLRRSSSFRIRGPGEPDLSWREGLAKEGGRPPVQDDASVITSKCFDKNGNNTSQKEGAGADMSMLGSWIDNLCLDEIVA